MASMLNKWDFEGMSDVCYGEEFIYQKAADFFGRDSEGEDWGCGMGWFIKYYCPKWKGIDGSLGYVTEPIDLVSYKSKTENIFIRQVLEHNLEWKKILENAKDSFTKKLCIGIHTPLSDETHLLPYSFEGIPEISFNLKDITDFFKEFKVRTEDHPTKFDYDHEVLIYVER